MNIATETEGTGEDVVVLHPWTHDHHSMQPIKDLLINHYRVTMVDLPGAGGSDWSDEITDINAATDMLLPHLPDNAIYVGCSWGGFVGLSLAARFPDKVSQFIGISTSPKPIEDTDWPAFSKPGFAHYFSDITKTEDIKKIMIDFYNSEFADNTAGNPQYQQLIANIDDFGIPMKCESWIKGLHIADATDLREDYKQIRCPIDFIIGELDDSMLLDWDKVIALNANTKVHFIEGARHFPMWTHPDSFTNTFNTILRD